MTVTHDKEMAAHRVDAYIRFLMDVYNVDVDGLALIAGVTPAAMRKFQAAEWKDKSAVTIYLLASLTGVSMSWLFAESEESEG